MPHFGNTISTSLEMLSLCIILVLWLGMYGLLKPLSRSTNLSSRCIGQTRQWVYHRKMCKVYPRFTSSAEFQTLEPAQKVDSILLSQLIALMYPDDNFVLPPASMSPSVSTFLDLLPRETAFDQDTPPICAAFKVHVPKEITRSLFSRFGNNNFLLHSHLTPYAHGIYPLASRLFNHSCYPNSVARYTIKKGKPVKMEVIALRDIPKGEEVRAHLMLTTTLSLRHFVY